MDTNINPVSVNLYCFTRTVRRVPRASETDRDGDKDRQKDRDRDREHETKSKEHERELWTDADKSRKLKAMHCPTEIGFLDVGVPVPVLYISQYIFPHV